MFLGIDYGSARIGLALSEAQGPALPWKIIDFKGLDNLVQTITEIIQQENIELIVVGWPLSLQGKITERTTATDTFIKALAAVVDREIVMEDERLTSSGIEHSRGGRPIDDISAAQILQTYIDRLHAQHT